jgi:hypothetical protein
MYIVKSTDVVEKFGLRLGLAAQTLALYRGSGIFFASVSFRTCSANSM